MDTLKIESALADKYKYKPLPSELSSKYRELYEEQTPKFLEFGGSCRLLYTKKQSLICYGYDRIVIGDYGAFIEFNPDRANLDFFTVKLGEEYRIDDPYYSKNIKYEWFTINDDSDIKIYKQKKTVSYADYKPNMYYVSVHEVM